MIEAIKKNLERGINLLNHMSNEDYSNITIAPYYSSIGSHIRHVLDVFDCVFEGLESNSINLINRKRNVKAENFTAEGLAYFNEVITKLDHLDIEKFNTMVTVTDDLGMGVVTANYTLSAILIQAHSHAIHHFASIGYVISQLGIDLPDEDFGFNPTTPKAKIID